MPESGHCGVMIAAVASARGSMREGSPEMANRLVGTWRLVAWENRVGEADVTYPFGEDPVGYIMYGSDGYMSVSIMRRNRAPFAAGDLLSAEADELQAAARTYVSYCGHYEVGPDRVIHHVEVSLFPNWVGMQQERLVEFRGDRLTLSTHPLLLEGRERTAHLVWERMPLTGETENCF